MMKKQVNGILYVDDEAKSLKYFDKLFNDKYKIFTAKSAADAYKILKKKRAEIGVILADQKMPREPGVDLLKKARDMEPEITRILVTAYSDLDLAVKAINLGQVFKYIEKPWDFEVMENTLEEAFKHHEKMRQQAYDRETFFNDLLTSEQFKGLISDLPYKKAKRKFVDFFEECYFRHVLLQFNGNVSKTAEASGINRRTIQRILKRIAEEDKIEHLNPKLHRKIRRYYED